MLIKVVEVENGCLSGAGDDKIKEQLMGHYDL